MKEWKTWELELLKMYKIQGIIPKIIAQLLSRSIEDVEEKIGNV